MIQKNTTVKLEGKLSRNHAAKYLNFQELMIPEKY